MKCNGPQCDREQKALGLCTSHYYQQYRGRPLTPLRAYKSRDTGPEGYAFCLICETYKKREEFYVRKSGSLYSECKTCKSRRTREDYRKRQAA